MDSRATQATRGAVSAAVATFTALAFHVLAGAPLPGAVGILVPFVLSVLVSVALIGRRLSLPRLAVTVTVSQVLFHVLFVLGTPVGSSPHALHGHANHDPLAVAAALGGVTASPIDMHAGVGMWVSHAVAAIVTVAALHRGESVLRMLLRLLFRTCASWSSPAPAPVTVEGHGAPTPRPIAVADALVQLVSTVAVRRGPPVALSH